ncbi:MAG: hypothetical protein J6581_08040 [Apibacter sp.]|jgi:hypothetical protein|nr:hypothetical protein [Apibacter sp.]
MSQALIIFFRYNIKSNFLRYHNFVKVKNEILGGLDYLHLTIDDKGFQNIYDVVNVYIIAMVKEYVESKSEHS